MASATIIGKLTNVSRRSHRRFPHTNPHYLHPPALPLSPTGAYRYPIGHQRPGDLKLPLRSRKES